MTDPFEKQEKTSKTERGASPERSSEERLATLRDFFRSRPDSRNYNHEGHSPDDSFSADTYAKTMYMLDVLDGAFKPDEDEGNAVKAGEKYVTRARKDLSWFTQKGLVEAVGEGEYRLTQNGKDLVALRH